MATSQSALESILQKSGTDEQSVVGVRHMTSTFPGFARIYYGNLAEPLLLLDSKQRWQSESKYPVHSVRASLMINYAFRGLHPPADYQKPQRSGLIDLTEKIISFPLLFAVYKRAMLHDLSEDLADTKLRGLLIPKAIVDDDPKTREWLIDFAERADDMACEDAIRELPNTAERTKEQLRGDPEITRDEQERLTPGYHTYSRSGPNWINTVARIVSFDTDKQFVAAANTAIVKMAGDRVDNSLRQLMLLDDIRVLREKAPRYFGELDDVARSPENGYSRKRASFIAEYAGALERKPITIDERELGATTIEFWKANALLNAVLPKLVEPTMPYNEDAFLDNFSLSNKDRAFTAQYLPEYHRMLTRAATELAYTVANAAEENIIFHAVYNKRFMGKVSDIARWRGWAQEHLDDPNELDYSAEAGDSGPDKYRGAWKELAQAEANSAARHHFNRDKNKAMFYLVLQAVMAKKMHDSLHTYDLLLDKGINSPVELFYARKSDQTTTLRRMLPSL